MVRRLRGGLERRLNGRFRKARRRSSLWRRVALQLRGVTLPDGWILLRALLASTGSLLSSGPVRLPAVSTACTVRARGVGLFSIRAHSDDLIHALPDQEPAVQAAIQQSLRPGAVFVDAGSNIGYYAILAAQLVGTDGRVFAIEMMPDTAAVLRKQIALNQCRNVTVIEGALAATSGATLTATYTPGRWGTASISHQSGQHRLSVPTITLAEVLRDVERVSCLKLDLEGAELQALQGLGDDLAKVETLVFENKRDEATLAFLRERQFTLQQLDPTNYLAVRHRPLT